MLPPAERTRANRGVGILIELLDQVQDNSARLRRGLKSPSLLLNPQVLQFSSWNRTSLKSVNLVYTTQGRALKSWTLPHWSADFKQNSPLRVICGVVYVH